MKFKLFRKIYYLGDKFRLCLLARKLVSERAIKPQTYATIQLITAPNINSQPTQTNHQMQLACIQNTRKTKTTKPEETILLQDLEKYKQSSHSKI